eukprot:7744605-Lingulodinium_polyedra.AAC.1
MEANSSGQQPLERRQALLDCLSRWELRATNTFPKQTELAAPTGPSDAPAWLDDCWTWRSGTAGSNRRTEGAAL